ncbi:MAG: TRAM domain-containing protein, partial [Muribaculaceae bacterium]|nr:TRAM domain-containing protein [Muribaculaceae bacterium]
AFDASFMFKYSERPGTLASRTMKDNVPEDVKIDRLNRMIALQNALSLESNRKDIGREFKVLVEGRAKRSADQMVGRTEGNKAVVFTRDKMVKSGDTITVKITDASSATLIGELV